jgi:protocatechuate 3,4-dioxygenase beta subunit
VPGTLVELWQCNAADPVLCSIDDPARRRTLIATRRSASGTPVYRFDIDRFKPQPLSQSRARPSRALLPPPNSTRYQKSGLKARRA